MFIHGLMDLVMKAASKMIQEKVKVFKHGLVDLVMKVAGKMIREMVMEPMNLLMAIVMKVATKMIKKKVKVFLHGEKEVNGLTIVMKAASKMI